MTDQKELEGSTTLFPAGADEDEPFECGCPLCRGTATNRHDDDDDDAWPAYVWKVF